MTRFWSDLLPNSPAGKVYNLTTYGHQLQTNKALLNTAFGDLHVCPSRSHFALLMAMAMQETNHLSCRERDTSKDNAIDGSANFSMFNLSADLLRFIGFDGTLSDLNDPASLPCVVREMVSGIHLLGVERFLNYVRGGRMGFLDGVSFGVAEYRATIATILSVFDMHPALLLDDRRVEINLVHV